MTVFPAPSAYLTVTLTQSARAVFRQLAVAGPATRPQLADRLQLSRPTLSQAIEDLMALGYLETIGMSQGGTGRRAAMYRLGPGGGHVIAVDAGSTHVRVRAQTVDGRVLYSGTHQLASEQRRMSKTIAGAVKQAIGETNAAMQPHWGQLRCLGIAVPTKIAEESGATDEEIKLLFSQFSPPADVPIMIENNVNCATIAEGAYGRAAGESTFVYIQIGVKIGMGIVLGGKLFRGRNGGAGEISMLPFPWAPDQAARKEELETYLGADAMMARVRAYWPSGQAAPKDARELFAAARDAHPAALEHVASYAKDVGRMVAASVAVLDPGFVVLGGGIGQNELLLPGVRQTVEELVWTTQIEVTGLGADATLLGIARLATDHAIAVLVGEEVPQAAA